MASISKIPPSIRRVASYILVDPHVYHRECRTLGQYGNPSQSGQQSLTIYCPDLDYDLVWRPKHYERSELSAHLRRRDPRTGAALCSSSWLNLLRGSGSD